MMQQIIVLPYFGRLHIDPLPASPLQGEEAITANSSLPLKRA